MLQFNLGVEYVEYMLGGRSCSDKANRDGFTRIEFFLPSGMVVVFSGSSLYTKY